MNEKTTEMLTCGIFYCRDSAEINDCGSLQTSSWLDSDVLRNRQQNIPPSVGNKCKKTDDQTDTIVININERKDLAF